MEKYFMHSLCCYGESPARLPVLYHASERMHHTTLKRFLLFATRLIKIFTAVPFPANLLLIFLVSPVLPG
jgi:hypothetical protein